MQETRQYTDSAQRGINTFIADVSRLVAHAKPTQAGTVRFILAIGERYAYIRLADICHPLRFFKQMAGNPPVGFDTEGLSEAILDDYNPARHYIAFVFVGFWLPTLLATAMLWAWEVASFVRYRVNCIQKDILSVNIGIRHGRLIQRYGPAILPGLIAAELTEKNSHK